MPLAAGQHLSCYEILGPLGAGGMGEVYLAKDTRLEREVAIKVLPEHFADDVDRLRRFEQEAKSLASLNHSNVAQVFGIDQVESVCFIAMELVDGEDLSERVARGKLPVDEAIDIARQIAEGLEVAHEAGIIHRDLKPANIRITPEGIVKILDFGLAKPTGPSTLRAGSASAEPDSVLVTEDGLILGTPTYMSPEQARGKPVDRRTDIWAFGCVLYECLTGKRAFGGENIADVMSSIVNAEVDLDALPRETPPRVRQLVARCLAEDPRQRLRDAGEARVVLESPYAELVGPAALVAAAGPGATRLPWIVAAVAVLAGLGSFAAWQLSERQTRPALRSEIGLSPRVSSATGWNLQLLSGGHRILFAGTDGDERQLWVRDLSELTSRRISGTEGAELAAVSPDEQWFAFFADNALKKISVNGGDPITLAETTATGRGGSWSEDGYIYYAPGTVHPIMRVPENGGEPEAITELVEGGATGTRANSHRWPTILPGGRAVLYLAGNAGDFAEARIEVRLIDSGEVRVLQKGGLFPRYFNGHIGFVREGALNVLGFDVKTLAITSPPAPVVSGVIHAVGNGGAQFSVSDNGTLIYIPGGESLDFEMQWAGPDAPPTTFVGPDAIFHPRFSPDGNRIAYTVGLGAESDVWIYDVERGQNTRLTLDSGAKDRSSAWSPDGKSIAFASNRDGGAMSLYRKPIDGSGEAVRLTESDHDQYPTSWSSDGRMLLFMQATTDRSYDVHLLRLDEDARPVGEPEVLVSSFGQDVHAVFSPDDGFISYVSTESGRPNVYVRSLDGTARWQISDGAGWTPRWVAGGRLYFHAFQGDTWQGSGAISSVDFAVENGTGVAGRPKEVLAMPLHVVQMTSAMFDVHPIDERLVVIDTKYDGKEAHQNPVLIQNWVEDLKDQKRP